nr:acyltransferase [uncultured Roseococcus sp.]
MRPERTNNFDALRLLAAGMVVLGHAFILVGERPYVMLAHSVSTIGVMVFFAISGYLITKSWMNDPHVLRFTWRRVRRIFPALILVVLVSIFIIGLALTPLGLHEYLAHPHTTRYFGNAVLYISYSLPLVFANNIYPHAVNGSLWTLPVEVAMYALTPLFVLFGRLRLALLAVLGIAIWLAVYAIYGQPTPIVIAGTEFWTACMLAPYFVAGAVIARFGLERWLDARIGLVAVVALHFAPLDSMLREALLGIVLPYAVLAVGLSAWPGLRSAGRLGDASYGIYLWSFPVQQITVHFMGASGGGWGNFAVAMPVSLTLGLLSWHLLEKHALATRARRAPVLLTNTVAVQQ